MLVTRPGAISAPKTLHSLLVEAYAAQAQAVHEERARRRDLGVPEYDSDFVLAAKSAAEAKDAALNNDAETAQKALQAAIAALEVPQDPPNEKLVPDEYKSVSVRIKAVSAAVVQEFVARVVATDDASSVSACYRDFVSATVAEVRGLEDGNGPVEVLAQDGGLDSDALELLDVNGLITPLMIVARRFQSLSEAEKKDYGSQPQAT